MAVWQKENGACTGRGFSPTNVNGVLEKYKTWVTKIPASGGPGWYMLDDQSAAVSDPYVVVSNIDSPSPNQVAKIVKVGMSTAEAGYIRVWHCLSWNSSTHIGRGYFYGTRLLTYDSADFAYDFRGGDEGMIIQTRTGTTWNSACLMEWEGDLNFLEGPSVVATVVSGVSAGSGVYCRVASGQSALFTEGNRYFICDMNDKTRASYPEILSIDAGNDKMLLSNVSGTFASGAIIGAYPHRFCSFGDVVSSQTAGLSYIAGVPPMGIPYYSCYDGSSQYVIWNQLFISAITGSASFDHFTSLLYYTSPNEDGKYPVQRPVLFEYYRPNATSSTIGMDRYYGSVKNVLICKTGTMARAQDGRSVGGKNYVFFKLASEIAAHSSSTYAALFLDTVSAS